MLVSENPRTLYTTEAIGDKSFGAEPPPNKCNTYFELQITCDEMYSNVNLFITHVVLCMDLYIELYGKNMLYLWQLFVA